MTMMIENASAILSQFSDVYLWYIMSPFLDASQLFLLLYGA